MDGETVRGTCDETGPSGVHLPAAMTHDSGIVVSQRETVKRPTKSFQPLLDTVDLAGVVVTAGAMYTQRTLTDYVLIVKVNQPNLFARLNSLDWDTTSLHASENTGRGRPSAARSECGQHQKTLTFPMPHKCFSSNKSQKLIKRRQHLINLGQHAREGKRQE
jgi:hypothetical protein